MLNHLQTYLSVSNSITALPSGSHLALVYDAEEQWQQALASFLRTGLRKSAVFLYLCGFRTPEYICKTLVDSGFPADELIASGQLIISSIDGFISLNQDAALRAEKWYTLLQDTTAREIFITSEMPFAVTGAQTRQQMVILEQNLHRIFAADSRCSNMCQYNTQLHGEENIDALLTTHPYVYVNDTLYHNPLANNAACFQVSGLEESDPHQWWNQIEQKYAVQHREQFLAQVLEHSSLPFSVVSPDGRIIDCNQAFLELTGYTWEELQHITWDRQLTPPEWSNSQQEALNRLLHTGRPQLYEKEYRRRDGSLVPVELLVHRINDKLGNLRYYYSFITDISLRKKAQTERRRLEQSLTDIFDFLPDPTFAMDLSGRITRWNKALEALTGIQEQVVKHTAPFEHSIYFYGCHRPTISEILLFPDKFVQDSYLVFDRQQNTILAENYCPAVKNGRGAYLWLKAAPLYDENGKVIGVIESMRDITERKYAEEMVRQSEEKYRTILENMEDGYFEVDLFGHFTFFNQSAPKLVGYTVEELIGSSYKLFLDRDNQRIVYEAFHQVFLTGQVTTVFDWQVIRKDGVRRFVESPVSPIRSRGGKVIGFRGLLRDISLRKSAEESLRASEERYRLVFENSPLGIINFDSHGIVTACNESFLRIMDIKRDDFLNLDLKSLHDPQIISSVTRALSGEVNQFQGELYSPTTGRTTPVEAQFAPVLSEQGTCQGGVGTFSDVTERRRYEETIRHLAYHDSLTGLPNRLLFRDRVTQIIDYARHNQQMVALMFLDLDNFKLINDTLGHTIGDRLLQEVASRLVGLIHISDLVSRMGGDEFVFLFPGLNSVDDAHIIAERILGSFRLPFLCDGHELVITASIGISIYPVMAQEVSHLMKTADAALYHAKQLGRNTYILFSDSINMAFLERLSQEKSLKRALDNQQFVLHYQPLVDLNTGAITGMEALVRWHHPDQGLLSPKRFIPLAEDTGLILELERWVIKTACQQNKQWQDAGLPPLRVNINLSGQHFWQQDLVETVSGILQDTGLSPQYLGLEITESTAIQNPEAARIVLQQLRNVGVQIYLDDFGTGYSSLSYLKILPVDVLKIDQSFVRDLADDHNNIAIFQAIMTLARNLNLRVTAEGVENENQVEVLKQFACDTVQGFLFFRPLTGDKFAEVLSAPPTEFCHMKC